MKKILLYNIIVFIIFFILSEISCFIWEVNLQKIKFKKDNAIKTVLLDYFKEPSFYFYDVQSIWSEIGRPVSGINYRKKPILLFGCSIIYGEGLTENNTFSAILSELTKRPVYNLALRGWTVTHMLRQLQVNKEIENLDPEYIIYTFITDQKTRLHFYQGWPWDTGLYLRYKYDKDKKLKPIERRYPFYYKFYITKFIQDKINKLKTDNYELTSNLMIDLFKESTKIIKERYPNAKLILLLYKNKNCSEHSPIEPTKNFLNKEEYKKLSELGFNIINIEQESNKLFCTKEYKIDDYHPSAKMWEEFTPILIKKYNM